MGCGFSTEDTKASDEERILKASDGVTGKAETTVQTRMGGTLAKKSPAKKRRGDSKCKEQDNDKNAITSASNGSSSVPLSIQSSTNEVSSSQVNFFKMLDEKIENGFELEEQDSDHERQIQLQRVAEEWDTILGRSQEDNSDPTRPVSEDTIDWVTTEANVESSNDSMRTMFSNSVNLPKPAATHGGRLCEVSNNNKSATMATATEAVEAVEVAVPAAAGRPSSVLRLQHQ